MFVHEFLTMECNVMVRSDNCFNIHLQRIQWRSDSLIYYFETLKVNQTGYISNYPWNVYSKPKNPKICPVLSLAKYFFSHTDILATNSKLFPGNHQYEIFLKIFHRIIDNNLEEFQSLAVEKGTLRSHSVRKVGTTIVASGCNVSPPMAYICSRSCWSMGSIKHQYTHYDKVGDQFWGRYVTGIS